MTTTTAPSTARRAGPGPGGPGRRRWMLPGAVTLALGLALGGAAVLQEDRPSTPLGAVAQVPGGLARVNGVLPEDEQAPGQADDGVHRVRVLLELTAVDPSGVAFRAEDWAVERLGARRTAALQAAPRQRTVDQGDVLRTELVFEVPDRAVEVVLVGADGTRLSLGADHHGGGFR
ncbi:hypothetical protein [Kocuria flava]|nr:hypothetical protein [Kocuria flava]